MHVDFLNFEPPLMWTNSLAISKRRHQMWKVNMAQATLPGGSLSQKHINPTSSSLSPAVGEIKFSSVSAISASLGNFLKIYQKGCRRSSAMLPRAVSNYYPGSLLTAAGTGWTFTSGRWQDAVWCVPQMLGRKKLCFSSPVDPWGPQQRQELGGTDSPTRLELTWRLWFPFLLASNKRVTVTWALAGIRAVKRCVCGCTASLCIPIHQVKDEARK